MSTLTVEKPAYLLDHDWELEPCRLALLEHHADPTSARRLKESGLAAGWRCLEVGAGRGSVARWLSNQVGPAGAVVALDLDTSLLAGLDEPNIEVLCGDVLDVELPACAFDLIHTRLVLMHIHERRRAIERMVSLLAPGGWLVLEELDWMALSAEPKAERVALFDAFVQALPTIDFQCRPARRFDRRLHAAGTLGAAVRSGAQRSGLERGHRHAGADRAAPRPARGSRLSRLRLHLGRRARTPPGSDRGRRRAAITERTRSRFADGISRPPA
jgi:SAM-dependent methyltransferase